MRSFLFLLFFSTLFCLSDAYGECFLMGKAILKGTDSDSSIEGEAFFEETANGLKIHVEVHNVPPGDHGFHVHEYGDVGNRGLATGGHYNPLGVPHGSILKGDFTKAHPGDFGNIHVDEEGKGVLDIFVPGLSLLHGRYPIAGRGIILHAQADDFGQPTGNAGGRIAAGTIFLIKHPNDIDATPTCCH